MRTDEEEYLYCAMIIGEYLLTGGAEVSRVEDTIIRICKAYGAERVDVFTITACIVATIYGKDFGTCTQTRRIQSVRTDFTLLEKLNDLSRRICAEKPEFSRIQEELDTILKTPGYSFPMQLVTYALISGSFAVFFGGTWKDMIASAIIGLILKCEEAALKKLHINFFVLAMLCSVIGGLCANLFVSLGVGDYVDKISIGNIMLFIPGLAFTNAIRDMFKGDMVTGLIKFSESILLAITIALGFLLSGYLF